MTFWITQGLGFIGLVFIILSFQGKTRTQILKKQMFSTIFFTVHFAMLGAFTGATMNIVAGVRNFVFEKKDKKRWASSPWWVVVFILFAGVLLSLSWQGLISLLPFFGIVVGTYARWRDNPFLIRIFSLVGSGLWFVYSIVMVSYPGIVTEVFVMSSILMGIWQVDMKKEKL